MNFRFRIVELEAHAYVIARQNIYSQVWFCESVRALTAREAAVYAAQHNLAIIHTEVDHAIRALFSAFPEIEANPPEIGFEPALRPAQPVRLMTIKVQPQHQGNYLHLCQ